VDKPSLAIHLHSEPRITVSTITNAYKPNLTPVSLKFHWDPNFEEVAGGQLGGAAMAKTELRSTTCFRRDAFGGISIGRPTPLDAARAG
jgi:hypothetical protein